MLQVFQGDFFRQGLGFGAYGSGLETLNPIRDYLGTTLVSVPSFPTKHQVAWVLKFQATAKQPVSYSLLSEYLPS